MKTWTRPGSAAVLLGAVVLLAGFGCGDAEAESGVPCIADDICYSQCARDPDCASGTGGSSGAGGSGSGGESVMAGAGGDIVEGSGGDGGVGAGGSGGGSSGAGAQPSSGGSGGGGGENAGLGAECESDADCTSGLTCLQAGSNSLALGGPASGLCSAPCGSSDDPLKNDEDCQRIAAGARCVQWDETVSYCLEGCTLGPEADKCHGRLNTICYPTLRSTGEPCASDIDCADDEGCFQLEGENPTCFEQPAACFPWCANDADCPSGRFCNARNGLCVDEEPTIKRFGESCDPDAAVNECSGDCYVDTCFELCSLTVYPSCNSESRTHASAACIIQLLDEASAPGDAGLCGRLCDCSAECPAGLVCVAFEDSNGAFSFLGRTGACLTSGTGNELVECPLGGEGGAGASL